MLPAQQFPSECTRNRARMSRQNRDLSKHGLRLIENAQLSQNCSTVIIDFLPRQIVISVEGVYTAKRELDPSPRRLKATPRAEVCAANQDFNENGVFCDMLALWVSRSLRGQDD
jgi:hypothetical protein